MRWLLTDVGSMSPSGVMVTTFLLSKVMPRSVMKIGMPSCIGASAVESGIFCPAVGLMTTGSDAYDLSRYTTMMDTMSISEVMPSSPFSSGRWRRAAAFSFFLARNACSSGVISRRPLP